MDLAKTLKSFEKKCTPERLQLGKWMEEKHLFTSNDVIAQFPNIGRASIFRTLKLFTEIGYLRKINLGEAGESYEIECCKNCHHEHMKCNTCGDILSFESKNICDKIFAEAKKLGFHIDQHSLSILGKCKKCI